MTRIRVAGCSLLVAGLLCLSLVAQQAADSKSPADNKIKVGVAMLANRSTAAVNTRVQRDRLVRTLNGLKPDKHNKNAPRIEAIPLDGEIPSVSLYSQARDKGCQFVVFTTLEDLLASGEQRIGGVSGSMSSTSVRLGQDPMSQPDNGAGSRESYYQGALQFKLMKMGNPTPYVDSSVSVQQRMSVDDAVSTLMDQVANRVNTEVRVEHVPLVE